MNVLWRFADLKQHGVVNSWPQLKRLQELHGFPPGRMLSPHVRAWTEAEIDAWINSRPTENTKPLRGALRLRNERRAAAAMAAE